MKSIRNELILIYLLILSYLNEILLELVFILYLYMYLLYTGENQFKCIYY